MIKKINEGTYGVVYKARDKKTGELVALKKGLTEVKKHPFSMSEIKSLVRQLLEGVKYLFHVGAPEILLGAKEYSTAIGMWSVGCIMAELIAKETLFRGKSELEQLDKIFPTLGTPDEKIWPGLFKLPGAKANFEEVSSCIVYGLPVLSEQGFDLLKQLLTYDPEKRITAEDALLHDWFHEAPLPKSDFKPIFPSWQ
ncbi:Cyclin-dependent kinase G-2 [Glycine soja]|uniref:Cyclin-dependent kinase G-2 n=1 Tax=Glycine soja TaxID=3848 RepID=A0A445KKC6_GLYSO|nr:Cyclin-dependent kinase G-2 [Glycine soja]